MRKQAVLAVVATMALAAVAGCKKPSAAAGNEAAAASAPAAPTPAPAAAPAPPQSWTPDAPMPTVSVSLAPAPTQPGDIPDSHDVTFLKRFKGASIIGYLQRPYDRLSFFDSSGVEYQPIHAHPVEGAVTRVVYRIPAGHGALEVLRNYEDLTKAAGLAQSSEVPCSSNFSGFPGNDFNQISFGNTGNPFYVGGTSPDNERPYCYFTAQGIANGQPIMVSVLTAEKHKYLSMTGADGKPLTFKDGDVVALVDLVVAKPVQNQMVSVKAADIADALATKGVFDLYGVYFDTDRTEVKPESDATLSEVANLLKIDRSLKLEISGHTDNSGAHDHNMSLSQGRADAVVQALVTTYGIDRSRLVAKGYGETKPVASNADDTGKAKNRRVELRKL